MTCTICHHPADTARSCDCATDLAGDLRALPWLYADLADLLAPGSRSGNTGRSSGVEAPLPVRVDVLDLRGPGGISGVLTDWAVAVAEACGENMSPADGGIEGTVGRTAGWLAAWTPWIAAQFEPAAELADEIRQLRRRIENLDGMATERRPTLIPVRCGCGWILRITADTPGEHCPQCQTWRGHAEVLALPYAGRQTTNAA